MIHLNSSAPHIHNATTFDDLVDWGAQPNMVEGTSQSMGRLLHKGPENIPETGIWDCTRGGGGCHCHATSSAILSLVARVTPMTMVR